MNKPSYWLIGNEVAGSCWWAYSRTPPWRGEHTSRSTCWWPGGSWLVLREFWVTVPTGIWLDYRLGDLMFFLFRFFSQSLLLQMDHIVCLNKKGLELLFASRKEGTGRDCCFQSSWFSYPWTVWRSCWRRIVTLWCTGYSNVSHFGIGSILPRG